MALQIILGLLLLVSITIMVTLIFIAYFLYVKSKQTAEIKDVLNAKEADLVEIYDSLEQMMEEIEGYTHRAKLEIQSDLEKIRNFYTENQMADQKKIKIQPETAGGVETEPEKRDGKGPKIVSIDDGLQISIDDKLQGEREKLIKKFEKPSDIKRNKVRAFYNMGVPVADIAREMGIGKGEVQLILNLKNKII